VKYTRCDCCTVLFAYGAHEPRTGIPELCSLCRKANRECAHNAFERARETGGPIRVHSSRYVKDEE
jgi:hypothetical protein